MKAIETDTNVISVFDSIMAEHEGESGLYVLEKGGESLLARAWLTDKAEATIDVQYFIWSTDNVGILASEALLRAAERGVKVRVIVDDFLIDADEDSLLALATHPNISIKIYNPRHSVGISKWKRYFYLFTGFRKSNQRLHNKIALFDGRVGITGGRNMAAEYYDFDHEYNFRDRDVILVGQSVFDMSQVFEEFWQSKLSIPVEELLANELKDLTKATINNARNALHDYAGNPENYSIEIKSVLENMTVKVMGLWPQLVWDDVVFISDKPGKNRAEFGLGGGGASTAHLLNEVMQAKKSITIQSPYLVMPKGGLEIFSGLIKQGVDVRVVTNSLASTDNLLAFSGYQNQKKELLKTGFNIFEYKPYPDIAKKLFQREEYKNKTIPVFAIHAKTMVVDSETLFVGTFNLDPRSANLNTEVGVIVKNKALASAVEANILNDAKPENSWEAKKVNANREGGIIKRVQLFFLRLLPMEAVL
ncbi:MAG: phospholipase D family protein [Proteobacteria bacterium]|nr:phospholipase D family protein [Pseudomonadota bacterium]